MCCEREIEKRGRNNVYVVRESVYVCCESLCVCVARGEEGREKRIEGEREEGRRGRECMFV